MSGFYDDQGPLTFEVFSERSTPLKTPDAGPLLWSTGLGEETAEVVEALFGFVTSSGRTQGAAKKIARDDGGEDVHGRIVDRREQLLREAGDVLFYLDKLLRTQNLALEDAAWALLQKLDELRKEEARRRNEKKTSETFCNRCDSWSPDEEWEDHIEYDGDDNLTVDSVECPRCGHWHPSLDPKTREASS